MSFIKKYSTFSIVITNALILFIAMNFIAIYLMKSEKERKKQSQPKERLAGPFKKYGKAVFENNKQIYGESYDIHKIKELLDDYYFNDFGLEYEPHVGFSEIKKFKSRHINVSKYGFREIKNQGSLYTSRKKVFVLGGSTTFGYGVSDHETIPSYMQENLNQNKYLVYNFGRGFYYSKQQLILLMQLINKGFIPDIVVSIDGVNEKGVKDTPSLSGKFEDALKWKPKQPAPKIISLIPVVKYYNKLIKSSNKSRKDTAEEVWQYDKLMAKKDVSYYLKTIKLFKSVCDAYGIEYYAFYQPSHMYKYDYKKYHPFYTGDENRATRIRYPVMDEMIENNKTPDYLYSLMDMQINEKRPLYVDLVHYNPYFNAKIARTITSKILKK